MDFYYPNCELASLSLDLVFCARMRSMMRQSRKTLIRMPPVQLRSDARHGPREAVVHDDRLALGIGVRVSWESIVIGQDADLSRILLDDGLNALPAVEGVEGGDGQAVEDNGEEDEPVDDWTHRGSHVVFLVGDGCALLGEEVASVLDVEDGTDT